MDTTKSSAPALRTTREDRAEQLVRDHRHEIAASRSEDAWEVPSCTGTHTYRVVYSYTTDVEPSCECPDFAYRGNGLPCKHILATSIVAAELHHKGGRFIRPADLEELAELTGISYPALSSAFTGERKNLCLDVVKAAVAAEPKGGPESWAETVRWWAKASGCGMFRAEDPEPLTGGGFLSLDYL